MTYTHDILRERLLKGKGLWDYAPSKFKPSDLAALQVSEWSPKFEQLMRNRLLMGALRYGTFEQARKKPGKYNYAAEVGRRMNAYLVSGNKEFLVDAANLCLLEFEFTPRQDTFWPEESTTEHNIHSKEL